MSEDGKQTTGPATLSAVLRFIMDDATERDLENINEALKIRTKALRSIRAANVKIGDQVCLTGLSPKYLNGLEGIIESATSKHAEVRLSKMSTTKLRDVGGSARFMIGQTEVRHLLSGVPLSCCETIHYEGS